MSFNVLNNFLDADLDELSSKELELWVYKAVRLYNGKNNDETQLSEILTSAKYIINEKLDLLDERVKDMTISLEDNIK